MPRPVRETTNKNKKKPKRESESRFTEVLSLLIFGTGIFLLLALLTYHPQDPSFMSTSHQITAYACGWVGAIVSAFLLQAIGLGAFLVPAAVFFLGATLLQKDGIMRMLGILAGMTLAVMSLTVFLEIQWNYWPYSGTLLLTGGFLGTWASESLQRFFNPVGGSIIALVIFFTALVLSTPWNVVHFLASVFRITALVLWRLARLSATGLAYLGGVILIKAAHWIGDSAQKIMEAALRQARERKANTNQIQGIELPVEEEPALIEDVAEAITAEAETMEAEISLEAENTPSPSPAHQEPMILPTEAKLPKETEKRLQKLRKTRTGAWKLPTPEFLRRPPKIESNLDKERLYENSRILKQKFADFGIEGEITAVRPGPVITLYEFKPGPGIKVSRIAALVDDLSMALSAESVRILAPLPGRSVVGIEIPSENREKVFLREFLQHPDFHGEKCTIPVVMGKDIGGQTVLSDLSKMPHLLVSGQTGSGKSVFMNSLICSLLYRFTPEDLRMILIDPKFIEFRGYQDIPHLLLPVVDDPKEASTTLKWAVREMERRYRILAALGVRNLESFNRKVEEMGFDVVQDLLFEEESNATSVSKKGADWLEAFEPDENGERNIGKLPYIIVIVDELADLMMIARKEVEISIARIAQKARAAGIHLVVATQRPSTDVITGLIKANLPSRVSFKLASHIDSKTILDRAGAERLLGQGDMLFVPPGTTQIQRLHGAFVDDDEIHKITAYLRSQGAPYYRNEILVEEEEAEDDELGEHERDALFDDAVELVRRSGHASASFLQRHLKIGYNRAARLIENMEESGIVGPADGARPRDVLLE